MNLAQILSTFEQVQPCYQLTIPKSWGQGRTIFGGVSAALAYQAAENLIDDERPIRSFHCNFIGPMFCDVTTEVHAERLRTGKNVTQIVAKVMQNGEVKTMAQLCFGVDRASKLQKKSTDIHSMSPPEKKTFIPQIPKLVPKFVQHFDYKFEKGNLGIIKSDQPVIHGWTKYTQPPQKLGIAHLIAMIDAWPPSMFQLLRFPVAASTMSWNIEFINPNATVKPQQWLACEISAHHIQDGYGHEEAKCWNEAGELIAISKQVVAVFT